MTTFEPPRPQDKVIILRRVPVFSSCSEEQLHLIADRTRLVEYKKGECVYRQGDQADAFYIISTGRLRIYAQVGSEERTIAVVHNGDSFGEISLLTGEVHSATVQALNDTLVLQLEKKDFDDVINKIPSLVLYLSRLLSKRLRTRELGSEFSEATIVAVYSAVRGVGRTCFAVALATQLRRETGREAMIVDFSSRDRSQAWLYGPQGPQRTHRVLVGGTSDEAFESAIVRHPLGFSVLFAGDLLTEAGGEQVIAPLLSFLTNRFAYILLELPADVEPVVLKALVQSDLVYILTTPDREHVLRTSALIHQLQASMGLIDQRMKVLVTMAGGPGEATASADINQQLGGRVAHILPYVESSSGQLTLEELSRVLDHRASPYVGMVRHMARELGGLLVGLALGSGAALGLAHIGILKVLEREKIPVDIIAGSSIGALVAGLWASGKPAEELEAMALRYRNPWDIRKLFLLDVGIPLFGVGVGAFVGIVVGWMGGFWTGLLFGFMVAMAVGLVLGPLAGGPIQGARLMEVLQKDFGGKTFEDTWLPLKIIAANPISREEVVFDSGPIADAVRASVSIPGIFKPITHKGKLCLDGGVVNPVPVSVLKRAGANHVIAVNVFPTTPELNAHRQDMLRRRSERDALLAARSLPIRLLWRLRQELLRSVSPLVFDVIMRSMQAMEYQISEVSCREADLTLRPTVPGSHWLEFFSPEKFIRRGEEVALQYLPELKRITRAHSVDNT